MPILMYHSVSDRSGDETRSPAVRRRSSPPRHRSVRRSGYRPGFTPYGLRRVRGGE
ncbi:hypothetical protein AB0M44_13070 [Streptosporangium subroseum]|uniref:hypothetical protein n=1 Tax=Streptosporangium subroseum TaxID=106412 RepID=UPI0034271E7F